jgi:hypothetical protein
MSRSTGYTRAEILLFLGCTPEVLKGVMRSLELYVPIPEYRYTRQEVERIFARYYRKTRSGCRAREPGIG